MNGRDDYGQNELDKFQCECALETDLKWAKNHFSLGEVIDMVINSYGKLTPKQREKRIMDTMLKETLK